MEQWQRADTLFQAALERPAQEREAWLRENCGADISLFREVASLLKHHESSAFGNWPSGLAAELLDAPAPLEPGQVFGSYKIIAFLAAGGMGEVYRALDTQLDREVAVKVLPSALASHPARLARFEREAKALAALNHPNIAVIYGLAEMAGQPALAMELVPGETLASVIRRKPLPFAAAAPIARQIAEALEAAHEKGIVHRDLKPGNVMVTPAGLVKVLDFGLAMTIESDSSAQETSETPTATNGNTAAGAILGTTAYLSPEQAAGLPVDKRSDIWSYGVVLWEMLTGKPLFDGGRPVRQTANNTARPEIDFGNLPPSVPAGIVELLQRCLDRDPNTRLRDIGEARVAIARSLAAPAGGNQATLASQRRRTTLAWLIAIAASLAAAILGFLHFRQPHHEARVIHSAILPPPKTAFSFTSNLGPLVLSPDGQHAAFAATGPDGKSQLWIHSLADGSAHPLPGTERGQFPFWAPDSRWLAFFADAKLKKIDTQGGPPIILADAQAGRGGSWSSSGIIVFSPIGPSPLLKVSSQGGEVSMAAALDTSLGGYYRFPWFLPDGKHFLFTAIKNKRVGARQNILLASLDSAAATIIGDADSNAEYADGRLLFLRGSTLVAQPFDLKTLHFAGEPTRVAEDVEHFLGPQTLGLFSVSNTGLLAWQPGTQGDRVSLTWYDRSGKPLQTIGELQEFAALELSPDRQRLAASATDSIGNLNLMIFDLKSGLRTGFTFDPASEFNAVWSPDGRTIVFNSDRQGHLDLYRKSANGSGPEELLYADDQNKLPNSWSPDGRFLLYHTFSGSKGIHVWKLPLEPERPGSPLKPVQLFPSEFQELFAHFSPDGRWVMYSAGESQNYDVYVAPVSHPAERHQISIGGSTWSRWRADGKEIFFLRRNGPLMAVDVHISGDNVQVGAAHPLFSGIPPANGFAWDISADGQRILAALPSNAPPEPVTLLQNWSAAIKN